MNKCKKYIPYSSDDIMDFTDKFCMNCIHEKFIITQNEDDRQCEILSAQMMLDSDEEGREEWILGKDGQPTCTAFHYFNWFDVEGNIIETPEEPINDPNQLKLEL